MQLIILGMHRSGSSALARIINMMGAYFGPENSSIGVNNENTKGFWERRDIRALNDLLLYSINCDWDKTIKINIENIDLDTIKLFTEQSKKIIHSMDAFRPWIIKEPRMCFTLPKWEEQLECPIYLLTYRDPMKIAKSLNYRNNIPEPVGIALWEKYTINMINHSQNKSRLFVNMDSLMKDPYKETEKIFIRLREFGVRGIHMPHTTELYSFIDPNLFNRNTDTKESNNELINEEQFKLMNFLKNNTSVEFDFLPIMSEQGENILKDYEANISVKTLSQTWKSKALNNKDIGLIEGLRKDAEFERIELLIEEKYKKIEEKYKKIEEKYKKIEEKYKKLEQKYDEYFRSTYWKLSKPLWIAWNKVRAIFKYLSNRY